jgi:hypothetical protein
VIANALTRRGCRLSDIETLPAIQPCLPRRTQAAPRGERGGDDQKGRRRARTKARGGIAISNILGSILIFHGPGPVRMSCSG